MSEHVAVLVDRLPTQNEGSAMSASSPVKKIPPNGIRISPQRSSTSLASLSSSSPKDEFDPRKGDVEISISSLHRDDSKSLLAAGECRICQEEDDLANLETPCACSGSLKYAHRKCVQHWCNEKGDTICEICLKPYEGGYTAPPTSARANSYPINIGNSWEIASGQRLDLGDTRLIAVTSDHIYSDDYEEYARANERSAACFRSVALILMVLLLLRHLLSLTSAGTDEEPPAFFMLFLLRAAGFFLPCYIMARALNILQCRRQQREEAALAAAQVAYILQSGQGRGVHIAVSAASSSN